jgi:hypothetical protein
LSRARLPIPPQGLFPTHRRMAEVAKPAEYSGRLIPVNPRAHFTSPQRGEVKPEASGEGLRSKERS